MGAGDPGPRVLEEALQGETLRSMLLNAYGWWKVSQITYIAAIVSSRWAAWR